MDNTLRTYPILEKIVNVTQFRFIFLYIYFLSYFLAATMPMSATFINIFFHINCCRKLTTLQDYQVSSVTLCFNPAVNPGIKLSQSQNLGITITHRDCNH